MKRLFSIVAAAAVVAIMCAADSAPEKITIWMMGDSTMADKPIGKMNPERGWGQYFRSLFDDGVQVKNRAQNGRSTKSFITRGLWSEVEAGMKRGDYVFIQFGHNDQKESDPERFAAPWGEYSENLRLFVQTVLDKGAVPVLLTPIARRHFDSDGNLKNVHADYPAAMKSVAQEKGVLLIDMTSLTGQWLTGLGDEASQEYFMNVPAGINPRYPDGLDDNTHLNGKGACVVARFAAQQVRELIP